MMLLIVIRFEIKKNNTLDKTVALKTVKN